MSCCESYIDGGCYDHCPVITLSYNAVQNGVHTVEVRLPQGVWQTKSQTYTSGNAMTIGGETLNETGPHDIKIKQPDGSYYAFSTGITCLRITTQIKYTIGLVT